MIGWWQDGMAGWKWDAGIGEDGMTRTSSGFGRVGRAGIWRWGWDGWLPGGNLIEGQNNKPVQDGGEMRTTAEDIKGKSRPPRVNTGPRHVLSLPSLLKLTYPAPTLYHPRLVTRSPRSSSGWELKSRHPRRGRNRRVGGKTVSEKVRFIAPRQPPRVNTG